MRVHLLVDYEKQTTRLFRQRRVASRYHPESQQMANTQRGERSFSYPDLQGFEPGNRRIPRTDWLAWKKAISTAGNWPERNPAFRTTLEIQYGLYKEPVEGCNPSVSVRYTLDEGWPDHARRRCAREGDIARPRNTRPGREQWHGRIHNFSATMRIYSTARVSVGATHSSTRKASIARITAAMKYGCARKSTTT